MAIFHTCMPLVLASGSPRRHELLGSLGLQFKIQTAADEVRPRDGEAPAEYTLRAARDKAEKVFSSLARVTPQPPAVVAADTIVTLDGRIFGKPHNHAEALHMLQALAGQIHTVYTACCLLLSTEAEAAPQCHTFYETSRVEMWRCPESALAAYAASEEPMDKAGAYAVQGAGSFLIKRIEGSWSNVVGLPLSELTDLLLRLHVIATNDHAPETL